MCLEEQIHMEARREGLALVASCYREPVRRTPQERSNMPKRYKRLLLALAAVASIYLVRATGLDQGLIDEVLDAAVAVVTNVEEAPAAPEVELPASAEGK